MVTKTRRPAVTRYPNRTRILAGALVFILLGSGIVITLNNVNKNETFEEVLTATNCPPLNKSEVPILTFNQSPQMCIRPTSNYVAIFETTEGKIKFELDTERTPNTVNNFIVLTNYRYYDNTLLFRLDPTIAIIQGGAPHTNNWSDPGPGYTIADECVGCEEVFMPLTNGMVRGPFNYLPGQLVMARSAGLNSSGAQFFFTTGEEVAALDQQGSYIVFGKTNKPGLEVLQKIMGLYQKDASSPYGGGPSRPVILRSVTIEET